MYQDKSVGGFLSETFSVIGDNIRAVAIYAAVVGGVGAAGVALGLTGTAGAMAGVGFGFDFMLQPGSGLAGAIFLLVTLGVYFIAAYFLLREMLRQRGRLAGEGGGVGPYLGLSILAGLGVIAGMFLLVVPGIILLVRWSAANGFLVGRGDIVSDAFGNSWRATEGFGWTIFFAGLILTIGVSIVLGIVVGAFAFTQLLLGQLVGVFLDALSNAASFAFSVAVYLLVHDDTEEVAEVFS